MENIIEKAPLAEVPKGIVAQKTAVVKSVADVDGFIEKRQEFIQKVNAICVEGKDYHIIQGKKSLAKGGAEKIASIFQWNAIFEKDTDSLEMLGQIVGLVAFKCTLAKGSKYVGEGRGAATLSKNASDPNKTLEMAQKSAFIDGVLRASGLSDFFTQDLEDMQKEEIAQPQTPQQSGYSNKKPSDKQAKLIKDLAVQKKLTQAQLKEMAAGKNPSQLIEALFNYKAYEQDENLNGNNLEY